MKLQTSKPSIDQLPNSFAVLVDNINSISVTGEEAKKYLQGQLTCDLEQLDDKQLLVGGHCDAKGKLFAAFRLIKHNDQHLLIQSKQSIATSLAELKKFGVFAKVNILEVDDLAYLALCGSEGVAFIQQTFLALPDAMTPVIHNGNASVIYICGATNRYLVVASKATISDLSQSLTIDVYPSEVWTLLEIQSGFVHLNSDAIGEYVPQMLNLQHINGISFTKGCYLGQETVARMKYLGRNKKALYALQSVGEQKWQSGAEITDESSLEKQLGENWRNGGNIIAHFEADNGTIYVQAVLANDTEQDAVLRLKHQNGIKFSLMPLPYTLSEES